MLVIFTVSLLLICLSESGTFLQQRSSVIFAGKYNLIIMWSIMCADLKAL